MAYAKVPHFIPRLRERKSYSRLALEFGILTAARSGEGRHAVFDEFDREAPWPIANKSCPEDGISRFGITAEARRKER
jgi:hypothetical protein